MRIRERQAAKRLVEEFETAVLKHSLVQATPKEHDQVNQEYFEAKFNLLTYIYKLGSK